MLDKEQKTHRHIFVKKSNFVSNGFSYWYKNAPPEAKVSAWVWKIGPDVGVIRVIDC